MKGDKVLIRIPATWEGIEAAERLEAEGKKTHVILVSSFAQAAAAAQAGVSVVQVRERKRELFLYFVLLFFFFFSFFLTLAPSVLPLA